MSDLIEHKSPARYRLQIIVNRDLVCPPDGLDEVVSYEVSKLANLGYSCVAHHLNRIKERPQKKRLGEFTIDDVLPHISRLETRKEYTVDGVIYPVRMNSQRYFVFRENLNCVACGLKGTRMMLEQHPGDKTAHFNLYAEEDGELVLMTKDHIKAKSQFGTDELSNFATMCSICNNIKAHYSITLEQLRGLRNLHNANKATMPKRVLSKLVIEELEKLVAENAEKNIDHVPSFSVLPEIVVTAKCEVYDYDRAVHVD